MRTTIILLITIGFMLALIVSLNAGASPARHFPSTPTPAEPPVPTPGPTMAPTPIPMPTITATPMAVDFTIVFQGGEDQCRYLEHNQRMSLFAETRMIVELQNNSPLPSENKARTFTVVGPGGDVIVDASVPKKAVVFAYLELPEPGVYRVFDRENTSIGQVGEIHARPQDAPGGAASSGWCP